jgi:DNA-binding response OmpR family regulator
LPAARSSVEDFSWRGVNLALPQALSDMNAQSPTILVIEDHPTTRSFLSDNLSADGYEVIEAEDAREGRHRLATTFPDLAIVDLGLPDGDGLDLLEHVRTADRIAGRLDPDLPLLVLSGRVGELDRLRGFERGCDDYVLKPFSYHELSARVRALLRRTQRRPGMGRVRVGSLEIDSASRQVWVRGEPVALSKKEYALLRALAGEPTRVCTREELLRGVWGFRAMGHTRTLDSHAFRLRQKLNRSGDRFVINVWGTGYLLVDGDLAS